MRKREESIQLDGLTKVILASMSVSRLHAIYSNN